MQKVAILPKTLPLFFLDANAVLPVPVSSKKKKNDKPLILENGKVFEIQFTTPKGRVKNKQATFLSKEHNIIISDRWLVAGRKTYIPHNRNVKVIAKI